MKTWKQWAVVMLLAVAIRASIFVIFFGQVGLPNSAMLYVDIAHHIIDGKGLGNDEALRREFREEYLPRHNNQYLDYENFVKIRTPQLEEFQPYRGRSPGYILFMTGIFATFGTYRVFVVQIFQLLLNALAAVFIFLIGRELWSHKVGIWAATLFALWVPQGFVGMLVMHDSLIAFCVAMALFFYVKAWKNPSKWGWVIACSVALGLGVNIRESVLVVAAVFVGGWWLHGINKHALMKSIVMGGLVGLMMLPWALWNYTHIGKFIFLIPHKGISLIDGIADSDRENRWEIKDANGIYNPVTFVENKLGYNPPYRSPEFDDVLVQEAIRIIKQDPLWYTSTLVKRFLRFTIVPWSLWQQLAPEPQWIHFKEKGGTFFEYLRKHPWTVFWKIVGKSLDAGLFLLALLPFYFEKQNWRRNLVFFGIPLLVILGYLPMKIQPQYIVPMQVPFFLLAAAGIIGIQNRFFKK
jgi:4-amino-4-deoxy-L-arabinose transferase-like glycosyltransferase